MKSHFKEKNVQLCYGGVFNKGKIYRLRTLSLQISKEMLQRKLHEKCPKKNGVKLTIISDRSSKKLFLKTAFTKIFSSTHSIFFIINEKLLIFEKIVKFFDFYLDLRDKPVVYDFFYSKSLETLCQTQSGKNSDFEFF